MVHQWYTTTPDSIDESGVRVRSAFSGARREREHVFPRRGRAELRELPHPNAQIALVHDVVAVEHASRLVTRQLHGDVLGDARAHEIPHGGPPQVVDDAVDELRPR